MFLPFCVGTRKDREVLATYYGWSLLQNTYPGSGLTMLLIVPDRHAVGGIDQFRGSDWGCIGQLIRIACRDFGLTDGGLVARFGDPLYSVGTIPHFHMNLIRPDPDHEYRLPLSKNVEDHKRNYEIRLMNHRDELLSRGGLEWLLSEDCTTFLVN